MDKCRMTSRDLVQDNIEAIGKLFPNCLKEVRNAEGELEHQIDFDALKQELSRCVIEGRPERYEFNWPGKRAAALLANTPIEATLRPCRKESVNFDTTENLYIEGDNLDVLKLLCDNYRGKIKMIYIDPPYNTGEDRIYKDNFLQENEEYSSISGDYDGQGNRMVVNSDSSGRFHTNWLNIMFPRLKIAQKLLTDDGIIFISIDDDEVTNVRRLCDEVFGEQNFIANIIWQKRTSPDARTNLGPAHDYIVVYSKSIIKKNEALNLLPLSEERKSQYQNPDNDSRGAWASVDITGQTGHATDSQFYEITTPGGTKMRPPLGRCWALSEKTFQSLVKDNRIWFGVDGNSRPRKKIFLSEVTGGTAWTWWPHTEVGNNQESTKELKALFGTTDLFDNPKPTKLLNKVLQLGTTKNSLILDFFSGSATTAHAVMQLNAEDGGQRKFIMVQIPELCEDGSEAEKAGYKNICEIGKERIRRAGNNIKTSLENEIESAQKRMEEIDKQLAELEEKTKAKSKEMQIPGLESENLDKKSQEKKQQLLQEKDALASKIEEKVSILQKLDIGFRVLKLDSSNMAEVYYRPEELKQNQLEFLADNVKPDRTAEDLLFQVMLEKDIPLSSRIETEVVEGKTIFNVADGYLLACLDTGVTDAVVTAIAKKQPIHAVFRDAGMATDSTAINFEQIFTAYSPDTKRAIL